MSLPIVKRELLGTLRMRRALVVLLVLTFSFSMIVMLRWPTDGQVDISGTRALQVFQVFAYTLLAAVLFVTPSFPATAIVQEKTRGTLALLINSPLNAISIYFGKFTGCVLFALLLLLTSLPAAAACYAMGGLDLVHQVGMLYLVLFTCVVQYTTLALLVSSLAQSTDASVRITYALVFTFGVIAAGPHMLLQGKSNLLATIAPRLQFLGIAPMIDGFLQSGAWWLHAVSPIPIVMELIGHGGVGDLGIYESDSTMPYFFTIAAVSSFMFAVITISRLNYRIFDQSRSKGTITDELSIWMRILRRLTYLVDPQRRKAGIPFFLNPVMVKEFRTRRFGRAHWLMRLVAGCSVLSLVLALTAIAGVSDWGPETIGGFLALLQIALIVLIVPSLTAGLISTERETGGWELLRMTPVSTFKILRGKLLSVLWTVTLILLATLPGYLVMILIKPVMWKEIQLVLICLALAAIYTICVGAAVGALFRKTTTATMMCYVVLIVLFLGPLLIWMGRDAPFSHSVVETALAINPTGAALSIIKMPGFSGYELMTVAWPVSIAVSVIALFVLSLQVWRITRPI